MTIDFQPLNTPEATSSVSADIAPTSKIDFQPIQTMVQNQNTTSTGNNIIDNAYATSSGFLHGAVDAVGSMGSLANNVLKGGAHLIYGKVLNDPQTEQSVVSGLNQAEQLGTKVLNKGRNYLDADPTGIVAQHPMAAGIGGTAGYLGGMVGSGNVLAAPINAAIGGTLDTIAPTLAKSPILSNTINLQGQAGVLGAASDPENPIQGAIKGMAIAAPFAAAGSLASYKLQRSGDIVNFETDNLVSAGVNPNSVEGISRIQKSLRDNGLDYSKYNIQKTISTNIKDKIEALNPYTNNNEMPAQTISRLAQTNYNKVTSEIEALKKPLVQNTEQFPVTNFNTTLEQVKTDLPVKIPTNTLTKESTIDDMWTYRQRLDEVISAAKRSSTILKTDLVPLYSLRQALTTDLTESANKVGMNEQWNTINNKYANEIVPYQVYNTSTGKLATPKDVNDSFAKINRLMNARNVNPNDLEDVIKTLGPDGRKVIGQAMLQNMYEKSLTDKGLVNRNVISPTTYFGLLKKAQSSGISGQVWDLETRQAAQGIGKILDGADEALKTGAIQDSAKLIKYIPNLLASRPGITLLKTIGSSKTPQANARALIQQLIIGTLAIGAGKKASQNSQ